MNRRSGFAFLLLSFATVLSSACSSSNGSTAGGACANYVTALRDAALECGRFNISPTRESEYLARFQKSCENALNAPGSGITPGLLDQCANKIREECGDDDACEEMLEDARGTLLDGSICDVDYQCASGECRTGSEPNQANPTCGFCAAAAEVGQPCPDGGGCVAGATCHTTSDGTTTTSICVADKIVNEGEPCGGTNGAESARCAPGLYCQFTLTSTGSSAKCAVPAPEGAECSTSGSTFIRCKAPFNCVNGTCSRLLAAGAACEESSDCGARLGCDPQTKKCTAMTWGAAGAPCDDNLRRCERGFCRRDPSSTSSSDEGTCVDYLADGSPCDRAKAEEAQCDSVSRCIDGTCQLQDPSQCK